MAKYNMTLINLLVGAKAVKINSVQQDQQFSQIQADSEFFFGIHNALKNLGVTDWIE